MIVTVLVAEWELEEDQRILHLGDEVSFWLRFEEADRHARRSERVQVVRGIAQPLPTWLGAEAGRHPVRLDVAGGALYWDAPQPAEGPIEVAGSISSNTVDAPDEVPATRGVVRRIRMEWSEFVQHQPRHSRRADGDSRYEDVPANYFPAVDIEPHDPDAAAAAVSAELKRRAARGEPIPKGPFVTFAGLGGKTELPIGATKTRVTGVLLDLELLGLEQPEGACHPS